MCYSTELEHIIHIKVEQFLIIKLTTFVYIFIIFCIASFQLPVDTLQEAVDNIELNSDPTTFKDLCKILDVELPVLANELRLERKYETRDLDVCDDLEHLAGVVVRREYCSNR